MRWWFLEPLQVRIAQLERELEKLEHSERIYPPVIKDPKVDELESRIVKLESHFNRFRIPESSSFVIR